MKFWFSSSSHWMCLQWFTSFTTSATIRLDHFVLKSHDIILLGFYWVHSIPLDCACAKPSLDPVYLIPACGQSRSIPFHPTIGPCGGGTPHLGSILFHLCQSACSQSRKNWVFLDSYELHLAKEDCACAQFVFLTSFRSHLTQINSRFQVLLDPSSSRPWTQFPLFPSIPLEIGSSRRGVPPKGRWSSLDPILLAVNPACGQPSLIRLPLDHDPELRAPRPYLH